MNAMNTVIATNSTALPGILSQPAARRASRRSQIDDFRLDTAQVDRFNRLLVRLGRKDDPLDSDQLATAARQLRGSGNGGTTAPCIVQRMRQVAALRSMVADGAWTPANDAIALAMVVIGYVNGDDDLIPDQLQGAGRLDDAIVVDTAWPRLSAEVGDYLDFRRLHLVEATLRGCTATSFAFTRDDWQQARIAEASLARHQRAVRERSYVPTASAMFRVH